MVVVVVVGVVDEVSVAKEGAGIQWANPFWFISMWDDGGSALRDDTDWVVGMVAATVWNRKSTLSWRHGRDG